MTFPEKVSIPYGKGKVFDKNDDGLLHLMYQFPMGKVKKIALFEEASNTFVSIPYGKGKEQHLVLCFYYNT